MGKQLVGFPIAFDIARDLALPIARVRCGELPVVRTPMPKAPIDEDGESRAPEDDVHPAGDVRFGACVLAKAAAATV
jgi:hypothetical protein